MLDEIIIIVTDDNRYYINLNDVSCINFYSCESFFKEYSIDIYFKNGEKLEIELDCEKQFKDSQFKLEILMERGKKCEVR